MVSENVKIGLGGRINTVLRRILGFKYYSIEEAVNIKKITTLWQEG